MSWEIVYWWPAASYRLNTLVTRDRFYSTAFSTRQRNITKQISFYLSQSQIYLSIGFNEWIYVWEVEDLYFSCHPCWYLKLLDKSVWYNLLHTCSDQPTLNILGSQVLAIIYPRTSSTLILAFTLDKQGSRNESHACNISTIISCPRSISVCLAQACK